jgi:hypothetical protein
MRSRYCPLALTAAILSSTYAQAQTTLAPVGRAGLCVTDGAIAATPDGTRRIETPGTRALAFGSDGRSAEIRFRYLGPTAEARPLASGELRRQIGIKLRSLNQCNLLYAMWRIEPEPVLVVQIKSNPGQSTHRECDARGYVTIRPMASVPVSRPRVNEWHTLRAALNGSDLTLTADGVAAWRGTLPTLLASIDGPSGLRTDNGRFDFALAVAPGRTAPDQACRPEPGD